MELIRTNSLTFMSYLLLIYSNLIAERQEKPPPIILKAEGTFISIGICNSKIDQ